MGEGREGVPGIFLRKGKLLGEKGKKKNGFLREECLGEGRS